jgi:hypothetical protein
MAGPRRQAMLLHQAMTREPARFNLANPWPQWIIEEYPRWQDIGMRPKVRLQL